MAVDAGPGPGNRWKRIASIVGGLALVYVATAYVVAPFGWKRYTLRHPELEDIPRVVYTGSGIPADPLNVELIGPEDNLKRAMVKCRWYPADPLTLRSCLEIAEASVLKRPYDAAPVSSEYLFGRKEDLARLRSPWEATHASGTTFASAAHPVPIPRDDPCGSARPSSTNASA